MGEKHAFRANFPLFVVVCEPRKRHPVSDVTVIDVETQFATVEIWGELFLQAFTSHQRIAAFLKLEENKGHYYSVFFRGPRILRKQFATLRDYQGLKVGVILDPGTPELHLRISHSDIMRLIS